jgi:hypothetical protein
VEALLAVGWYRTIRLVLWVMAMLVAAVPALLEWLEGAAFNNTLFRDVLFVIIPAAALGLSTVLDYLCMRYQMLNGTKFALSVLAIIFSMLALASGLVAFLEIPKDTLAVTVSKFWLFSVLIGYALFVSLLTELLVSADNHQSHAKSGLGTEQGAA